MEEKTTVTEVETDVTEDSLVYQDMIRKAWKTLMMTGLKERFSTVRLEFFMKVASDGKRIYDDLETLNDIIDKSYTFRTIPDFTKYTELEILPGDHFKHYEYQLDDNLFIEYFANVDRGIVPEIVEMVTGNKDDKLFGACFSNMNNIIKVDDSNEEEIIPATFHLILIGEGEIPISPDEYPVTIKHELAHACLYELTKKLDNQYDIDFKIPATWTDSEIEQWTDDLLELHAILKNPARASFHEFICEFMMYESEGQVKVQNPVIESRVPKTTKSDAKPKVTFRNLTPFDKFEEDIDKFDKKSREEYQFYLNCIKSYYDDYDAFLDSLKF